MKHPTIEQLLLSCIDESLHDKAYVEKVMNALPPKPEIFSTQFRIEDDQPLKKGSFMSKLRSLPLAAIILLALGVLLAGGGAYAAVKLFWAAPEVKITEQTKTIDGRQQTKVQLAYCSDVRLNDKFIAETSRRREVAKEEVIKYIVAQCETAALESYFTGVESTIKDPNTHVQNDTPIKLSLLDLKNANSIKTATGLNVTIDTLTQFVSKDGSNIDRSDITSGGMIGFIVERNDVNGSVRAHTVVLLSQDAKYYDQYGRTFYIRQACEGNASSETCLGGNGAFDLNWLPVYSDGYDTGGPDAPSAPDYGALAMYEGVITQINDKKVSLITASGRALILDLPFADEVVSPTSELPESLKVGDTIQFRATRNDSATVFTKENVMGVIVIFEPLQPGLTAISKKY